jgi:hypothetical protein
VERTGLFLSLHYSDLGRAVLVPSSTKGIFTNSEEAVSDKTVSGNPVSDVTVSGKAASGKAASGKAASDKSASNSVQQFS